MRVGGRTHSPDYVFIATVFLLALFGIVVLSSASSELGKARFNDTYFYLKHQFLYGFLPGLLGFLLAYKTPITWFRKLSLPALVVTIVLLILVFTPLGFKAGGALRWVNISGFTFQPAEFLKLTLVLYLAAWLASSVRRRTDLMGGFVPFMMICGVAAGLLILQPTTSTMVVIMTSALLMFFIGGGRLSYIGLAVLIGIVGLALVIYITPYRWQRIVTHLNPNGDLQGTGFQRNQALIALGSGGIFGVGYGDSISKFHYLPEPINDSIFAVIGEEFGFVGSALFISAFFLLIMRMFKIAFGANDLFMKLAVSGIACTVGLQAFINIAAISGLAPLTGIPLPFISYGGTALAMLLTSMGLVANVSKYSTR